MHLLLSRATITDLPSIFSLQFNSFINCGAHDLLFGFNTPTNIALALATGLSEFHSHSSFLWLKVVDADAEDEIVGASSWNVYPTFVAKMFDAKLQAAKSLKADDVVWFEELAKREDAAPLVAEYYGRVYGKGEAHIREFFH